jgi:hypothetical protein
MSGQQRWDAADAPGEASRRTVLQGIVWAGSMAVALTTAQRVTLAQEGTPDAASPAQPFMGETFLGATSDPNTFLAIVVAEGAGDGERQARAYICNAADIVAWFDQGTVNDDGKMALRSPGGLELAGELIGEGATGTITLPGGKELTFETAPATGADGLYTFILTPDGTVAGRSAGGGTIEGQLTIVGAVTPPAGEAIDVAWPVQVDDTAELRTIFREEAGRRGEGKSKKGTRFVVQP